jgi:hypothetical protein
MVVEVDPLELEGDWLVRRVSGLLPPRGLSKRIGGRSGSTRLGRLPLAPFRVDDGALVYRWLPVRDELTPLGDGTWAGRGLVFGREFCRFRLVRPPDGEAVRPPRRVSARSGTGRTVSNPRAKGADMSSTQMPEGQGGGAAADPEPKERDREEQERKDESDGSHEERHPLDEDEKGAGQGSAGGAV